MIEEEALETCIAIDGKDMIEMIDGLIDTMVVVIGTFVAFGIDMEPFWDEVQRSNMSKLGEDGKPILREDGKFLKGPNFFKPDIAGILEKMQGDPNWIKQYLRDRDFQENSRGLEPRYERVGDVHSLSTPNIGRIENLESNQ